LEGKIVCASDPARGNGESVTIVYGDELTSYHFSDEHPLQPSRHQLTMALLHLLGWLDDPRINLIPPRPATTSELMAVHSYPYIQAVTHAQAIARGERPPMDLTFYGLGLEDNPLFEDIADAPTLYSGATIQAMEALLEDRCLHAYSPAGGMHHAMKARAAGFCVYNDISAGISVALAHGRRVAYLDLDAHHGDGVQDSFYDDPRVLTISIHESGRFLFPGTGEADETGKGEGYGTCINVPLPPMAGDDAILRAFDRIAAPALKAFAPDILVTQTGCDTHHSDPLTDLAATLSLYPALAARTHALAHEVCDGRWLILGGGGYDPADVTPRAWAAFMGTVLGHETQGVELPPEWIALSRAAGGNPPAHLLDDPGASYTPLVQEDIQALLAAIERTALAALLERFSTD
jgi:acetoin utilization protein AcuC